MNMLGALHPLKILPKMKSKRIKNLLSRMWREKWLIRMVRTTRSVTLPKSIPSTK